MATTLPQHWLDGTQKSLSVSRDLRLRGDYPSTLSVYVVGKTKNLDWRYLPAEEEDPRPFAGRTNQGKGKRKYETGSTGTDDPWAAGKAAIAASISRRQQRLRELEGQQVDREHSLSVYWENWITRQSAKTRSNATRWIRDKRLLWSGTTGIGNQSWATLKSIERITYQDFESFFIVIGEHCLAKGFAGDESKRQYKTLIGHLFKEALTDYPQLVCPKFPEITKQVAQVVHLTSEEWDLLLEQVIALSGGAALQALTPYEYSSLQWTNRNKKNQRNWVDLYDALNLQWFFYLRSEDAPRLQSEWWRDNGEQVVCYLEKTKGNRDLHDTYAYRPDAYSNTRRMLSRKPKGYSVFPWIQRKERSENESNVGATLNELLQVACKACGIEKRIVWTNIRHTAFRLTLEEYPELGTSRYIRDFAENGHTSPEMLHERYLRFIEREATAKKAQANIAPGKWSLTKRVPI
jgi:hypothetical protein